MTKYELYQILDENGLEPSEENLAILTEGLDCGDYIITEDGELYENFIGTLRGKLMASRERKIEKINKKEASDAGITDREVKRRENLQKKVDNVKKKIESGEHMFGGANDIVKGRNASHEKEVKKDASKLASEKDAHNVTAEKLRQGEARMKELAKSDRNVKKAKKDIQAERDKLNAEENKKKDAKFDTYAEDDPKTGKKKGESKGTLVFKENYSLYELYCILDNNGFEPTNENLEILKENLADGNTTILSVSALTLTEDMSEDDIYAQILSTNGFKVNENNITVLKEAMDNGHILLEDKKAKEEKKEKKEAEEDKTDAEKKEEKKAKAKQTAGNVAKLVAAGLVGAAAVVGGGNAVNAMTAASGNTPLKLSTAGKVGASLAGAGTVASAEALRQHAENKQREKLEKAATPEKKTEDDKKKLVKAAA